ncbi:MAG: hypothetical protein B7Y37_14050, partial [Sphingobacteriia bacterium 28-36-52]
MLVMIGTFGLHNQATTNESLRTVYSDRTVALGALDIVIRATANNRLAIASAIIDPTPNNIQKQLAQVDNNRERITKNWDIYMGTYAD